MPQFNAGDLLTANDLKRLPQTVARLTTAANGTASTGNTDTADAVMGTLSMVADGVSFYRIQLENMMAAASGSGTDTITYTIRDGGASAPTSASPAVASAAWKPAGVGGSFQEHVEMSGSVQLSAGTHTFQVFTQRGSGTLTNGQPIGTRTLKVSLEGDV